MASCITNKVLLELSHVQSFTFFLWLPLTTRADLSSCSRGPVACEAYRQYLLSGPLQRKFADPCFSMWAMFTVVSTGTRRVWHMVVAFTAIMCDK